MQQNEKKEKVEIVVQYIIEHYTEYDKVDNQDGAEPQKISVIRAQLLMEKETSYFKVEKMHCSNKKISNT